MTMTMRQWQHDYDYKTVITWYDSNNMIWQ